MTSLFDKIKKIHIPTTIDEILTQDEPIHLEQILRGFIVNRDSQIAAFEAASRLADLHGGVIATMPELVAAKSIAPSNHILREMSQYAHTEENIGIDKQGRFYGKGEMVLVIVNGGGILTPKRMRTADQLGYIDQSIIYSQEEFDTLLDGALPNGDVIDLYPIEEIQQGISNLPRHFGVVMPFAIAQKTGSSSYSRKEYLANPLVIARAGGLTYLEAYFTNCSELRKRWYLDNLHCYWGGRNVSVPQGRLLHIGASWCGMSTSHLGKKQSFYVIPQKSRV